MNRCHLCMEPAKQGFTLFIPPELILLHCGVDCRAVIDQDPQCYVNTQRVYEPCINENYLILLSVQGCLSSILLTHTVIKAIVCTQLDSCTDTCGRIYALVQLRTPKQHLFFSVYLANDFSPVEPVHEFPPGFSFELFKTSNLLTNVIHMSLHKTDISAVSHLLEATATNVSNFNAGSMHLSLSQDQKYELHSRLAIQIKLQIFHSFTYYYCYCAADYPVKRL